MLLQLFFVIIFSTTLILSFIIFLLNIKSPKTIIALILSLVFLVFYLNYNLIFNNVSEILYHLLQIILCPAFIISLVLIYAYNPKEPNFITPRENHLNPYQISKIICILPAYNEEANIRNVIDSILIVRSQLAIPLDLLLINDGSTDLTGKIMEVFSQKYDYISVIHHKTNLGKSYSIFNHIPSREYSIYIIFDTDLQFHFNEIKNFIEKIKSGYDLCNAVRINRADTLFRRVISKLFNFLIRSLFDLPYNDVNSGFKAFNGKFVKKILQINLFNWNIFTPHRFILVIAHELGLNIAEIPVHHYPRIQGSSHIKLPVMIRTLKDLIKLRFFLSYRKAKLLKQE